MQASVHAPYVFACTGPYFSQIEMDQRCQIIYGIKRTGLTFLSTYFTPSTQVIVPAPYMLACTGLYLSQIG